MIYSSCCSTRAIRFLIVTSLSFLPPGCGNPASTESNSSLSYDFFDHPASFSGVLDRKITVCLKTNGAAPLRTVASDIKIALETWIAVLYAIGVRPAPSVSLDCQNPNYRVLVLNATSYYAKQRSDYGKTFPSAGYVSRANSDTIVILAGTYQYSTLLHEFGHAFAGLFDTYDQTNVYKCKPGAPIAIMCSATRFGSMLQRDDRNGIGHSFAKFFQKHLMVGNYFTKVEQALRAFQDKKINGCTINTKQASIRMRVLAGDMPILSPWDTVEPLMKIRVQYSKQCEGKPPTREELTVDQWVRYSAIITATELYRKISKNQHPQKALTESTRRKKNTL